MNIVPVIGSDWTFLCGIVRREVAVALKMSEYAPETKSWVNHDQLSEGKQASIHVLKNIF